MKAKLWVMVLVYLAVMGALILGYLIRARATGFPVVDLSNLAQSILRVMNSYKQITNQITQIGNQMNQIQNQLKSLQTFGQGSSFGTINNQMMEQMNQINQLLGKLTVIRYRTESIHGEFQSLFPLGSNGANQSIAAYGDTYARWNDELLNATLSAMDSQGVLSKLTTRNLEITKLLDQAGSADGEVRQLQVVNQMLALAAGHLSDLSTALISTGRMTSTMTAVSASQERVAFEAAKRARRDYTSRGKSVPVLQQLPTLP